MKLLNSYKNGNIKVQIFDDGTRIIDIPDDEKPNLQFPLSMDFKITKNSVYFEIAVIFFFLSI